MRYRIGHHNPHLIYRGSKRRSDDETFLAACLSPEIAAELVEALNNADQMEADARARAANLEAELAEARGGTS